MVWTQRARVHCFEFNQNLSEKPHIQVCVCVRVVDARASLCASGEWHIEQYNTRTPRSSVRAEILDVECYAGENYPNDDCRD